MNHSGDFLSGDGLRLHWEEYGSGDRIVISSMAGLFYPEGLQQALARRGYPLRIMWKKITGTAGMTFLRGMLRNWRIILAFPGSFILAHPTVPASAGICSGAIPNG